MALNFERLESEVAELDTVVQGVVVLLNQVAAEIRDNAANQAKIEDIASKLDANAGAMAAATAANTPAEGENPIA
jgi:hypothetical protein